MLGWGPAQKVSDRLRSDALLRAVFSFLPILPMPLCRWYENLLRLDWVP